jgi:hypothetical protein
MKGCLKQIIDVIDLHFSSDDDDAVTSGENTAAASDITEDDSPRVEGKCRT